MPGKSESREASKQKPSTRIGKGSKAEAGIVICMIYVGLPAPD